MAAEPKAAIMRRKWLQRDSKWQRKEGKKKKLRQQPRKHNYKENSEWANCSLLFPPTSKNTSQRWEMVPTRMRENHAEDAQSYECETTTGTNKNGEKSGWWFFESGYFILMGPLYVSLHCSLVVIFFSFSLHFHLFPLRSRPPAPSVYPQCPLQCCRWPLWEMREITEDFYPSDPDTPFFFSSQLDAAHARVLRRSPTSFYENMLLMFGRPCSLLVSWFSHPVVITASLRLQQDSICISTGLCLPFLREELPTQIPPPHTYYF